MENRIAIIGLGSIGSRHLRNLISLGESDLIVFDQDLSRAQSLPPQVTLCSSLQELYSKNPSIVVVASATDSHVDLARAALAQGCHVFIEKPLSFSLHGLDELARLGSDLVTMVGCNMRFHAGPRTVHEIIQRNGVGLPLYARLHVGSFLPSWRPHQDYTKSYSASPLYGGAVLDCIHEIDLALWLFGKATLHHATSLSARSIMLDTDGLSEILLLHQDPSVLTSLHLNFIQHNYHRSIEVIGEHGTIVWDYNYPEVSVYRTDGKHEKIQLEGTSDSNAPYLAQMRYFLDCVRLKQKTFNDIAFARQAVAIASESRNCIISHQNQGSKVDEPRE